MLGLKTKRVTDENVECLVSVSNFEAFKVVGFSSRASMGDR